MHITLRAVAHWLVVWPCALAACSDVQEQSTGQASASIVVDTSATYVLVGVQSQKCVAVQGASTAAQARLEIATCDSSTAQQFSADAIGGGYYRLRNVHSGMCMDVSGASTASGAAVIQWPCHTGANQQWSFTDVPGGAERLTVRHSGQVLDVTGANTADGTLLEQWPSNGGTNQEFTMRVVAAEAGAPSIDVVTNRYDNARTGANTQETHLTTANVNATSFGFRFSAPITGFVYGQPLYISGVAGRNVVYVATAHNMVYAVDADTGASVWARALEAPLKLGPGGYTGASCGDMVTNEVGIVSTPVIDRALGRIYVVAKTSGRQELHALDLATGADVTGSPVTLGQGTAFSSDIQLQRPGLLLVNGVVYMALGSHCDVGPYHGWIFGYDASSLALKVVYNTTPGGSEGAIWQSGMGLGSDGANLWAVTGNGSAGGADVSMSVVELKPSGSTLGIGPRQTLAGNGDNDLCAGPVLFGGQVLAGGKDGNLLMVRQADASLAANISLGGEVHNMAVWDGGAAGQFVYAWGDRTSLHAWQLTGGTLASRGTNSEQKPGHPGGMITVSSNGAASGTGIVWALLPVCGDAWKSVCPGALYAFDASDITKHSLWNSGLDSHAFGNFAKFSPPTVANGTVYAATWSGTLVAYGLK